ncbi:NAD(P)-binding domain-containing protein [Streptomyces sp. NEAU-sy36]|uniref:NADPH-dependent F420 reductase n=1 Tax=unclassified Streptomyces TaxID=2593676 RepID=UPI0015D6377B|nr:MULTISPECIES: NAD(P)-binding domain-containing protein [unclassified Streptomyces]QLJ01661.1 NAD(P)-binding domain-containing protein [Streptomyces sp. NEAU-sy36]
MRYGVLGTGEVGRTLAGRLVELGHEVTLGSRTADNPVAREWATASASRARAGTFADAAEAAELVINAVSGQVALDALRAAGAAHLNGKVLVDVCNPLSFEGGLPRLDPVDSDSLGERIQRAFPGARVVKALNTVDFRVMTDPGRVPGEHHLFVCGESATAKERTRALLGDLGWPAARVLDLGGIAAARALEMYVPLRLQMARAFGHEDFNIEVRRAG